MKKYNKKERVLYPKHSKSYVRAYEDIDFMHTDNLRPMRLQLELLKPEIALRKANIEDTVVCFGSARILEKHKATKKIKSLETKLKKTPRNAKLKLELRYAKGLAKLSKFYDVAREFGKLVSKGTKGKFVVVTGGGPGIMEAANRGAYESGHRSLGFNITLPHEQEPNNYITPNLAFCFHYFAVRKMHLVIRSRACVIFPGGSGTLDEFFEILTLVQTQKKDDIPMILVGKDYWNEILNIKKLEEYGVVSKQDLKMVSIVDTAKEAWGIIKNFYKIK
ncbi:MAG: TIGR00730 family Rossman fold protein [Elusimicrobiaceae bacterium]|nr:TIGR00730 family Rossman fold protein [Elusimicrobiaceae bacterium]MBT3955039.1 TIGR00730 family Rossman fold protein [Elusimicrobiaceae bacterium]MBT4008069.1 TIGR00730 family Rossman fold protein [Elusimicrobiaceae bacterium]MBT4403129.1 TIGR00730 family Rossman fold protein [Elusimicrobiaceae bacterium]MBT4439981.1 TIGR00730 family Rossman fold protein [Elusimicrobiaceae bacterium]